MKTNNTIQPMIRARVTNNSKGEGGKDGGRERERERERGKLHVCTSIIGRQK